MITSMMCEGYRSYATATNIELGPVTVLLGKNNSGKSTLARLPLFIHAAVNAPSGVALNFGHVRLGATFRDITSGRFPHQEISYGMTTEDGNVLRVTAQEVMSVSGSRLGMRAIYWKSGEGEYEKTLAYIEGVDEDISSIQLRARAGVPEPHYLAADARKICPVYELRSDVSDHGTDAANLFESDREVQARVSAWFLENAGIALSVDRSGHAFSIVHDSGAGECNLADAGRGTQSLFHMITQLIHATASENSHCRNLGPLIIEEPETHLHPAAHGDIASLIVQVCSKRQVILETHSEMFVLRLRRHVAEGQLARDDLYLNYVDETHHVARIPVASDGAVEWWPVGVFEEGIDEVRAIMTAAHPEWL